MGVQQLSAADATSLSLSSSALSSSQNSTKVRESAIQFEALLIGQALEKLEQTFAPTDAQGADPAHDTVSSLGTHAVAQMLAERHAFGFAGMLENALEPKEKAPMERGITEVTDRT